MKKNKIIFSAIACTLVLLVTGCDAVAPEESSILQASGVVEAVDITVASEMSGRVVEIRFAQGDAVKQGDLLFILENELLDAQYDQALAAVDSARENLAALDAAQRSAEAGVESAHLGVDLAALQYEQVLRAARLAQLPERANAWNGSPLDPFDLPSWYFSDDEMIKIVEADVSAAYENLQAEKANLDDLLNDAGNIDFRAIEERLALAQFSFELAQELVDRDVEESGEDSISETLQGLYDAAEAELESAQEDYDSVLTEKGTQDILNARAKVVVADERYQLALGKLYQLNTGEKSLEVVMAAVNLRQAELLLVQAESVLLQSQSGKKQAQSLLDQAQANLDLIGLQIEKLTIYSHTEGVIMVKTIEVGELLQPGATAMMIGMLNELKITIYVPEENYGRIKLGDQAVVTVDSFPGQVFSAEVIRIADQAEYTPRNVQTEEDRKTTVFAIELSVMDAEGLLKPGMPADVRFGN